jgi:hypothetical protein
MRKPVKKLLVINHFLTKIKKNAKKVSQNFTFTNFCRKMNSAPVIMYGNRYYEKR